MRVNRVWEVMGEDRQIIFSFMGHALLALWFFLGHQQFFKQDRLIDFDFKKSLLDPELRV